MCSLENFIGTVSPPAVLAVSAADLLRNLCNEVGNADVVFGEKPSQEHPLQGNSQAARGSVGAVTIESLGWLGTHQAMPFLGPNLRRRERIGLEPDVHLFHPCLPNQHQCSGVGGTLDHLLL